MNGGRIEVRDYPLVSVVTPSYNMARFLEETIQSVLSQDYPHIEYIVMDGGSTDGTLDILRKYEGRLRYVSQRDGGQADAINRGFQQSAGRIFAYLNADDTYLPGAVSAAVRHLLARPECAGVYGEGYHTDESGKILGRYPTHDFDLELLAKECFLCQPAVFLWRDAFAEAGMMNVDLHFALDYDLWIRIGKRRPLLRAPEYLATSRMYPANKTLRRRGKVYREAMRVVKSHFHYVHYGHIYGYACFLLQKKDGFFEPVSPSRTAYALALLIGLFINWRDPLRFWREAIVHTRFRNLFRQSAEIR